MTCGLRAVFSMLSRTKEQLHVARDNLVRDSDSDMSFSQVPGTRAPPVSQSPPSPPHALRRTPLTAALLPLPRQLAAIFERARKRPGAPAGALVLQSTKPKGLSVVSEEDGLFVVAALLRRGSISFKHFVVYNAGTRLLYLGPAVLLLDEGDIEDLELLAANIDEK